MLTIVHSCRKICDLLLFSQEIGSALDGLKFGFEFLNQNVKALWGYVCLCCPSTVGHKSFDLGDVISLFLMHVIPVHLRELET